MRSLVALLVCVLAIATLLHAQGGFGEEFGGGMDEYGDEGGDPYGGMMPPDGYGGGDPYGGGGKPKNVPRSLSSLSEIESFLKEDDMEPSVLGYFDSDANAEDLEAFMEVAAKHGEVLRFAYTTDREILESKGYDGCALLVYPPAKFVSEKYERSKYRYPGKSLQGAALEHFLLTKATPLVGQITLNANQPRYEALSKPIVTVFTAVDHERNAKGFAYFANRLRKLAVVHTDMVFTIGDSAEYARIMENDYELPSSKKALVGIRDGDVFYAMDGEFAVDALSAFIDLFKKGQLEGKTKETHAAPSDSSDSWDGSAVVVLNNDNFSDEVFGEDADVLVDFYAPWCGHCQALKPEYKKAADYFKNDKGVKLAAMDATAAQVPKAFAVEGYPSLYFVPAGSKTPVSYDGPREAEGIIAFLNKHRTTTAGDEL